MNIYCYSESFLTALMLLSLKPMFWMKSAYIMHYLCYSNAYLPSLPDLSGVSQFKKSSPGLKILVYFLPVSTEPLFFFCLRLNGMVRVCQPHVIISHNLLFPFWNYNFSPGQLKNFAFFPLGSSKITRFQNKANYTS